MRKFLFVFFFFCVVIYGSEWFEKNKELSVIYPSEIWNYIKKADYFDTKGQRKHADYYLRLVKRKIEEAKPFIPSDWPKGWPQTRDALKYLKYATPEAYLCRIIGDFAYFHGKYKETLKYYEMYIEKSIIPDTDYMKKIAEIYEKENMLKEARIFYYNLFRVIESKNFHGKKYSLKWIKRKIKKIDFVLREIPILVLDVSYSGVPEFIKSDFNKIFKREVKNIKNSKIISEVDFQKALKEEMLTKEDLQDEEELSNVGKILNAEYILRPSLTRIRDTYILEVDVFEPVKKMWIENYEFKTQDYQYLSNMVERFVYKFQEKEIPEELYLPENKFLWSFETDSLINDIKISKNGKKIIAGCESGSVYIFTEKGKVSKKFKMSDRVIKVAISGNGEYFSWLCLDGKYYFATDNGVILWSKKLGNFGRGTDISERGRFNVTVVNNKVYYLDRKGEIFWDFEFPEWASFVKISSDAHRVFVGGEKGGLWCISDEGNSLWKKKLDGEIVDIKISENGEFILAETDKNKIHIFKNSGKPVKNFGAGQDIFFTSFNKEILNLITGKRGNFFYFLSHDKKRLWNYKLRERVSFVSSLPDGKFIVAVEGKNIFAYSILWK